MLFNCYHKDLILYGKRRPPPKRKFCTVLDFFCCKYCKKLVLFHNFDNILCYHFSQACDLYKSAYPKR